MNGTTPAGFTPNAQKRRGNITPKNKSGTSSSGEFFGSSFGQMSNKLRSRDLESRGKEVKFGQRSSSEELEIEPVRRAGTLTSQTSQGSAVIELAKARTQLERDQFKQKSLSSSIGKRRNTMKTSVLLKSINTEVDYEEDALPMMEKDQGVDEKKYKRMTERKDRREWLIYPEDTSKSRWDIWLTFVLLLSCFITPYRIAFGEPVEPLGWRILSFSIDFFFLVDMVIICNTAFYDEEFKIVEDRKEIIKEYLKGWFIIDLLAIIPFDELLGQD